MDLKKILGISFVLYLISLLASMAGMEIFGWLTFLLAFAVCFIEQRKDSVQRPFFALGADLIYLALLLIVVLSYFIKAAPGADLVWMLGKMRWGILMYGLAYAARWTRLSEKAFVWVLLGASIISLHGIQSYFTAWDYIRNRPVLALVFEDGPGRSAGAFSMPTTFAHAASQTFCFFIAALLLGYAKDSVFKRRFLWVATGLLGLSLLLSFTRGAWLALACALVVITFMVSRRVLVMGVAAAAVAGGLLLTFSPTFQARVSTITSSSFASNTERMELWRLNWWIVEESPILGIGLGENERLAVEYNTKHGVPEAKAGNAHNVYLQWWAGNGILGLGAFLAFVGFYLFLTWKLWHVIPAEQVWHRTLVLGALGAQVTVLLGGLTDCNFQDAEVQHQYILWLAIVSCLGFLYLKNGQRPNKVI